MHSKRSRLLLASACGGLSGLCFGWPAGWAAIQLFLTVQVCLLVREKRGFEAAHLSAAFVALMYLVGQSGLSFAISESLRPWTVLVVVCIAAFHASIAWLTTWAAFRLPASNSLRLLLLLPAGWVARELLASRVDISVPWLALGYAQAPHGPFAGLFSIGGVFLVSGVTIVFSGALALAWQLCTRRPHRPADRRMLASTSAAGLAVFGMLVLVAHVEWTRPSGEATVELVQSGAASENAAPAERASLALRHYADVIAHSTAALVVTPQFAVAKTPEALPPGYLANLDGQLKSRNADALLGMYFESGRANEFYNGVQAIGASGAQRYRKQHLLPFGEYMPLPVGLKTWINSNIEEPRADAAPGPRVDDPLLGGGLRLALAVCYEIGFGEMLRLPAASADAIVNIASDGSHDSPQLARQTMQIAQARALEYRKPVVRTSDVRGTFFIDASGQVSDELPAGKAATITRTVHGRTGLTPYARWGDTLALGCVVFSIAFWGLRGALVRAPRRNVPDGLSGGPEEHSRGTRESAIKGVSGASPVLATPPGNDRRTAFALPTRQHGQVLPMALAWLVIVAGFFYFMVNTGQVVTEKIRVVNAADAAAYSAAVVEARALNYDAYLNRAMVANQMAIAQMVSFASWLDYFATASDRFGSYVADMNYFLLPNPRVAVLDVAFGGSSAVAAYFGGTVHNYIDNVVNDAFGPIITFHDLATDALMRSEMFVQIDLRAGIPQRKIADQVVKAMDPKLESEVVPDLQGFNSFTKNYSGNDRTRFADVAMRSRSPFTKERNFTLDSFDVPLVRKDGALKKRGGTDLVRLDEWRAVDTLELHGQRFFCGKLHFSWCEDVKTPIGWGAIEVDAGGGDSGHGVHGKAYDDNPTTAKKADGAMHSPTNGRFHGIPRSQEIANLDAKKEQTTGITILVSKSQSDTLTSGGAATVKPSGDLALFNEHPAGGKLIALGRAEVYFDRISARADGKTELGSLYNPYWRVRLVAPTEADRTWASTKQGGLQIPSISSAP